MGLPEILSVFPGLVASDMAVTSLPTRRYNCIAWAAGDDRHWWEPLPDPFDSSAHWPLGVARTVRLESYEEAFRTLGYERAANDSLELGIEKVALFVDANGIPKHAARQLGSGSWTSKLGPMEDIRHELRQIEGATYGTVAVILGRKRESP